MINKKITIILFFLSYVLILGHSIFPHDHHEKDVFSQCHAAEDQCHSDDFKLSEIFQGYHHSGKKDVFIVNHFSNLIFSCKTKFQSLHYDIDHLIINTSPPLHSYLQIDNSVTNFFKITFSNSGLRAPPLS